MKSEDKHNVEYKTDKDSKIRYMNPLGIFKLPLAFAGSNLFKEQVLKLNTNISINNVTDDSRIKYQIVYKNINALEVLVQFVVQDNKDIIIFNFVDKLISVPKLKANEVLVDRRVNSKVSEVYLIDILNSEILLIKSIDINKRGVKTFINPPTQNISLSENIKNVDKFITIDIEARNSIDMLKNIGDFTLFTPMIICGYVPLEKREFSTKLFPTYDEGFYDTMSRFFFKHI
jgi:hypothetical protein